MSTDRQPASDADRIAAARWAARELLLPHFKMARGRRGWIHTATERGGIRSSSTRRDRYTHA